MKTRPWQFRAVKKLFHLALVLQSTLATETLPPNELGKIPIITYHVFGAKESEFVRPPEVFYRDLLNFRKYGFWPLSLEEFITGEIKTPKGKIPVMLTFDDSSISQFRILENGEIDPHCAVGVMEKFRRDYPDYALKAVFFVMPKARYPNNLFGQPKWNKKKLEFLLARGYEIASHTYWHANFQIYHDRIEEQLAKTQIEIERYIPQLKLKALALPFGKYPPQEKITKLFQGSYKGFSYQNRVIFDYANKLSESPYSVTFDKAKVHRLHGFQGVFDKLFRQRAQSPQIFFVSDGLAKIITVPRSRKGEAKIPEGFRLQVY
ncbi:MAG: polysaccharide deacetylase family protein [Leptospiraceae bacterium]|nr:polysaccharide deacetylase family protein [Leptospiraceae bacterium]MDW8306234.1 polysaccharide deacetylase family protein [Leptospiraceae bacterium]